MRALKHYLEAKASTARGVTTQAHEGIETNYGGDNMNLYNVTTQAHEGIETAVPHHSESDTHSNNSSP